MIIETTIHFLSLLVETPCSKTFDSEGVIYSPNFPGLYPHNQTCRTLIKAPDGMVINFIFFDFEVVCNDSIVIYDGNNESSSFLGDLGYECGGYYSGGTLQSSGQNALLVFQSDESKAGTGFRILIQFRPGNTLFIGFRIFTQFRSGDAPFKKSLGQIHKCDGYVRVWVFIFCFVCFCFCFLFVCLFL